MCKITKFLANFKKYFCELCATVAIRRYSVREYEVKKMVCDFDV